MRWAVMAMMTWFGGSLESNRAVNSRNNNRNSQPTNPSSWHSKITESCSHFEFAEALDLQSLHFHYFITAFFFVSSFLFVFVHTIHAAQTGYLLTMWNAVLRSAIEFFVFVWFLLPLSLLLCTFFSMLLHFSNIGLHGMAWAWWQISYFIFNSSRLH